MTTPSSATAAVLPEEMTMSDSRNNGDRTSSAIRKDACVSLGDNPVARAFARHKLKHGSTAPGLSGVSPILPAFALRRGTLRSDLPSSMSAPLSVHGT